MGRVLLFIIFLNLNFFTSVANHRANKAVGGVLDLSSVDMCKTTYYVLNGEYDFCWKSLVHPDTIRKSERWSADCFADVPSYWTDFRNGNKFPGRGFATYGLKIILPPGFRGELTFDVPVFDSSVELFLGGKSVAKSGKVGTSFRTEVPEYHPVHLVYSPTSDTIDMVVWLSNFNHRRGGFWKEMRFGPSVLFAPKLKAEALFSQIIIGFISAFALFFLIFFISLRKDRSMIFFSVILIGVIGRLLVTNGYPIQDVFHVRWDWIIRLEYLSFALMISAGYYFFSAFLKSQLLKGMAHVNVILCALISVLVVVLPVHQFSLSIYFFDFTMAVMLVSVFVFSLKEALKGSLVAILNIAGIFLLLIAFANDLLVSSFKPGLFHGGVIQYAVVAVALMHAIILVLRWVETYREKTELNNVVNYINTNLEKLVSERTEELKSQNDKIEQQNDEMSKSLQLQNRIFSIIGHDLRSPVATLFQMTEVLEEPMDEQDRLKIIRSIRQLSSSTGDMIDNLVFWGRSQGNEIKCHPEFGYLKKIFNEMADVIVPIAEQKGIELQFEERITKEVYFDKELMRLVLRNLISNAIKFTPIGGDITVSVTQDRERQCHIVSVQDTGVGMDDEVIDHILLGSNSRSTSGTKGEKGTGLGLILCKDLIELHHGVLSIESRQDVGSKFFFTLPYKQKLGALISKEKVS